MIKQTADYDVIIIGGGPAGMAAAIWCSDLGLSSVIIEKEAQFGGQLLQTHNPINNYPGVFADSGRELRDGFFKQLQGADLVTQLKAEVRKINFQDLSVTNNDGSILSCSVMVIASGVRRRSLDIPGEKEFSGRGVLRSGAASRDVVASKNVVIIGGGDAAFENALILAETARSVTLFHRSANFSARTDFIELVRQNTKIKVVCDAKLSKINGSEFVETIDITDIKTGMISRHTADFVLIRIGVVPNNELVVADLDIDLNGYIVTNKMCMTNIPMIFAIGDIANPAAPTISGAAGDAATAVKAAYRLLTASKRL